MYNKIPVITIDGPNGVGKSSLSKAISQKIKWPILESGIIYRHLAFFMLKKKFLL